MMAREKAIRPLSQTEGPWGLPEGWEWVPLSVVCREIMGGGTPKRERQEFFTGEVVWITPSDLKSNNPIQVVTASKTTLTSAGVDSSSAKIVPVGTVLFSSRATIGKIAIAGVPLATNQGFANFICGKYLDNRYLAWCLYLLTNEIKKLAGSTTYLEVSRGNLREFKIPLPFPSKGSHSLEVQRCIVTHIEELLSEVKEARKMLGEMRSEADLLLSAGTNEVFNSLEPSSEIASLKKIASAFNGRASGEGDSSVRVFKTKHVYPYSLRLDRPSFMKPEQVAKTPKDRFLKQGDILMANIAEGTLGRVSYVAECEDNWTVDTQIMILRSLEEKILLGKWLYYYLWSERGQKEILARRSGIAFADKRGQTHIYPRNVQEIPVLLPPIKEQQEAVAYLDSIQQGMDEMRQMIDQKAALLEQLEKSILDRAFHGDL